VKIEENETIINNLTKTKKLLAEYTKIEIPDEKVDNLKTEINKLKEILNKYEIDLINKNNQNKIKMKKLWLWKMKLKK